MGLVDYSESEESDDENSKPTDSSLLKKDPTSKRGFEKVVDRSNPTKIRVSLPAMSTTKQAGATVDPEEPLVKKPRLGGGGSGGFNAMLPAPKGPKRNAPVSTASGSGLRRGVSLKTGAGPAFLREPVPANDEEVDAPEGEPKTIAEKDFEDAANADGNGFQAVSKEPDVKAEAKVAMFKPLSVARKPQKPRKKTGNPLQSQSALQVEKHKATTTSDSTLQPKVSLFSSYVEDDRTILPTSTNGEYQTTLYQASLGPADDTHIEKSVEQQPLKHTSASQTGAQSLDSIVSDLNLSAADQRRLFGRTRKGADINVTTFNTDAEYAANDEWRRSQDQQDLRNPVRAIAPGKHSLKQLVNAAVGQKEALEDSFAAGRRNKKEAGSKYGW